MNSLRRQHVESVCKFGQGAACCAFLGAGKSFYCLKQDEGMARAIRARLASGDMRATGDNCSGPPDYNVNDNG